MATRCTVSPPMASIFLRENCTLGGVEDIYIKYEGAGNKFVGRAVSGIPVLEK